MIFSDITDGNINLYAMKVYDNPQCIDEAEYHEDMKKTTYIKRLFNHYRLTGELKSRLILMFFLREMLLGYYFLKFMKNIIQY